MQGSGSWGRGLKETAVGPMKCDNNYSSRLAFIFQQERVLMMGGVRLLCEVVFSTWWIILEYPHGIWGKWITFWGGGACHSVYCGAYFWTLTWKTEATPDHDIWRISMCTKVMKVPKSSKSRHHTHFEFPFGDLNKVILYLSTTTTTVEQRIWNLTNLPFSLFQTV